MKKSKLIIVALITAMPVSLFTSCADKKQAAIDKDQHVVIAFETNDVKTFDSSKSTDGYAGKITQESEETLGREESIKGKDIITGAGASNWSVSPNGKTWTFKIRPNKWSDGKSVLAKDYEYSLKRTLDKKTASPYAYLLIGAGIKGATAYNSGKGVAADVGVNATDDKTLVITLDRPCPYFEKLLSSRLFAPQREDIVKKYEDKYGTTADSMVYCGPFKVDSIQMGSEVKLSKNNSYWDKRSVRLKNITVKLMGDTTARLNSLVNGEIDAVDNVDDQEWVDKLKADNKLIESTYFNSETYFMFFNQNNKLLANVNIRKALSLAYSHTDQIKAFWQGTGQAAYSWVPYGISIGTENYRAKSPEFLKDNVTEAKALLKKGLQQLGMSTDPSKITINYLATGTDNRYKEMNDWIIDNYKKNLGIKINAFGEDVAQYMNDLNASKYEMSGISWGADYNDPMTFFDMFESNANILPTHWSNKKYDALIENAKNTTNQVKRLSDFHKAEKILISDDAVIIPTVFSKGTAFRYKYVKNYHYLPFSGGSEWKNMYTSGR